MKKMVAASTVFLLFLFWGGLFTGLVRFIPAGVPRSVVTVAFGALFVATFLWLLIQRVRLILAGPEHLLRDITVIAADVVLLIMAFASVYQTLGIVDNTQPSSPVTHNFLTAIYYSVVTFTTLGYGDFYPQGLGRAMAAMEALTGYIILGILVSTSVSIIEPDEEEEEKEDREQEERGERSRDDSRRGSAGKQVRNRQRREKKARR